MKGLIKDRNAAIKKGESASEISEDLGEVGVEAAVGELHPDYKLDYTGSGQGTVDKLFKEVDPTTGKETGKILVGEGKGGSTSTTAREIQMDGPNKGKIAEQGSPEYLADIANEMQNSGDPDTIKAGEDLQAALDRGDVTYAKIVTPIPGGAGGNRI
jgi:hypothetical protein